MIRSAYLEVAALLLQLKNIENINNIKIGNKNYKQTTTNAT